MSSAYNYHTYLINGYRIWALSSSMLDMSQVRPLIVLLLEKNPEPCLIKDLTLGGLSHTSNHTNIGWIRSLFSENYSISQPSQKKRLVNLTEQARARVAECKTLKAREENSIFWYGEKSKASQLRTLWAKGQRRSMVSKVHFGYIRCLLGVSPHNPVLRRWPIRLEGMLLNILSSIWTG